MRDISTVASDLWSWVNYEFINKPTVCQSVSTQWAA